MTDENLDQREPKAYDVDDVAFAPLVPWNHLTPYERWQEHQGIPIHRDFFVNDLSQMATGPWELLGAEGAFIELEGAEDTNGAYLLRFPSGETTNWYGGLFEQVFFVVSGHGRTEARLSDEVAVCEWGPGSLFTVPVDVPIRHHGEAGALMYAVTSAPLIMNLLHEDEYVLHPQYRLPNRPGASGAWFRKEGKLWSRKHASSTWETTFIEDARAIDLPPHHGRGGGGNILSLQLGHNALVAHISEFPVGGYKKLHRHGPGAHVITLAGDGYSLLWKEKFEDRVRVDWTTNAVLVPPRYWWHQHFNAGAEPARYLAIRWGSPMNRLDHSYDNVQASSAASDDQVEYADENPEIARLYAEECKRRGVTMRADLMPGLNVEGLDL